ncbi:MAG: hypothetical protein ACOYI5_09190 [Christensenellales bacterium]|jgi:uncharacterized membrane protein YvbJ
MSDNKPMTSCTGCNARIPEGSERCPSCGKKIRPQLGTLTDEQIKRIRRPISIILWIGVALVVYFKYFR